jgi:hypothetical protein
MDARGTALARALAARGLQARAPGQPLGSIDQLKAWLDRGPLLLDGARWFGQGHWFVAIGYDENGIYTRDSSGWDTRYLTWYQPRTDTPAAAAAAALERARLPGPDPGLPSARLELAVMTRSAGAHPGMSFRGIPGEPVFLFFQTSRIRVWEPQRVLFEKDLFDLTWTGETLASKEDDETRSAIELALELAEENEWSAALDLTRDYVPTALAASVASSTKQKLLATSALCEAHVAAADRHWALAADWIFSGMVRCHIENDPDWDPRLAYQYLQFATAARAGDVVFSTEPAQLHVRLTPEAFSDFATAYVRLSPLGEERLESALGSVATLRNRVLEHLWSDSEIAKGRRRGAADIVQAAYQEYLGSLGALGQAAQLVCTHESFPIPRDRLLQALTRAEGHLLASEKASSDLLHQAVGSGLSDFSHSGTGSSPLES